ncbi:MAG: hypothetical protein Q8L51_01240 [Candidatus Amesbacteria bacterium]|nr:hypothetical protein [Candidatus Amesbacteria bacterium]
MSERNFTPAELEEDFLRQGGLIGPTPLVNRLCDYEGGIKIVANMIERSMSLTGTSGVALPPEIFSDQGTRMVSLFSSKNICKSHFRSLSVDGIDHESCPYTDMNMSVELVKPDRYWNGYRINSDRAVIFNIGKDPLRFKTGLFNPDSTLEAQSMVGVLEKGAIVSGNGEMLVVEFNGIKEKLGQTIFNFGEVISKEYSPASTSAVSPDGGKKKCWLYGPNGGEKGIFSRCAIGLYIARDPLIEPDDAYLHLFNSQVVICFPLFDNLMGIRPIFVPTGDGVGTSVLGKIGVWKGEYYEWELQKILPAGYMYLFLHTYPSSVPSQDQRYLKLTKKPRFGVSFANDVLQRLNG